MHETLCAVAGADGPVDTQRQHMIAVATALLEPQRLVLAIHPVALAGARMRERGLLEVFGQPDLQRSREGAAHADLGKRLRDPLMAMAAGVVLQITTRRALALLPAEAGQHILRLDTAGEAGKQQENQSAHHHAMIRGCASPQSSRKASVGAMRVARRAGSTVASRAVASSSIGTPT